MQAEYQGHTFTDADVVDWGEFIPANDKYNPHKVRPWLIYNEFGTLAVVFASCEQDAIDSAVDNDKMNPCLISPEDFDVMSPEEQEECVFLGNASEPFDLTYVGIVELPNPPFSFVALFNARKEK